MSEEDRNLVAVGTMYSINLVYDPEMYAFPAGHDDLTNQRIYQVPAFVGIAGGFLQQSAYTVGTLGQKCAGVTLVPVPTKAARSHSDIKGRRPFDVPASNFIFMSIFCNGSWLTQEPPRRFQTT